MNLFKRLFFTKRPEPVPPVAHKFNVLVLPRHKAKINGENVQGFYVEKNACIACGAPEAEAPNLIEHSVSNGECYFKKQPETEEEVGHAINAVMVSCTDALRYGGKDESILKRMHELGLSGNCDYKPANTYTLVKRNVVTFYFSGTINELAEIITNSYVSNNRYKVIDFLSDKISRFSFVIRLVYLSKGNLFVCTHLQNRFYNITFLEEDGQLPDSLVVYADELHTILREVAFATNILWYEGEVSYGEGAPRPW